MYMDMWRTCRFACTCTIAYMYMHKCMYMLWIRGERFLESSTGREGGISSDSLEVEFLRASSRNLRISTRWSSGRFNPHIGSVKRFYLHQLLAGTGFGTMAEEDSSAERYFGRSVMVRGVFNISAFSSGRWSTLLRSTSGLCLRRISMCLWSCVGRRILCCSGQIASLRYLNSISVGLYRMQRLQSANG